MNQSHRKALLAIGIEAAEASLVRRLIDQDQLPVLKSLLAKGKWLRVNSPTHIGTSAVWPCFMTGQDVADHGISGDGPYHAARDLLMRAPPPLGGEALRLPEETVLGAARRIAPKLQGGVLPIQGPPGTGKTHIGARMICSLVEAGARVGITATSHKVIRRLLDEVVDAAEETAVDIRCIQKTDDSEDGQPHLAFTDDNEEMFQALGSSHHVAGGTASGALARRGCPGDPPAARRARCNGGEGALSESPTSRDRTRDTP